MENETEDRAFFRDLTPRMQSWALELGFQQLGVTDIDLGEHEQHLERWLSLERHGEMDYMARHGKRRTRPEELIDGTRRVISVRMNYLPRETRPEQILEQPDAAYVSRYALGRDYHKLIRARLARLWKRIESHARDAGYRDFSGRVFTDSAPVMEKAIAEKAGLGWIGKNTLILSRDAGSWFFLGEIYTDLPLETTAQGASNHCGTCQACMDVCPTDAIVAPYELDARRCISYLTIEYRGTVPNEFRKAIGNRIFGCDDCQLFCPWNKFAQHTGEEDFTPRHALDTATLVELFNWTEAEFLERTEGSAIRRTGYEGWLRNIAIALGNGPADLRAISALQSRREGASDLVAEHIDWALQELNA